VGSSWPIAGDNIPRIVAVGEWDAFDAPPVTVVPPRHSVRAVVYRVAPAPRADLAVVLAAGREVIGSPYVPGGTTPAGFDCSGFVAYAYGRAGVALPRTTSGIRAAGVVISPADARPGDILYWPGHVALYAGPGLRLDANRPGQLVAVRAIYGAPRYIRIG
jgi:cell wall-associated NlpC family hydrolase